MRSVWAATKSRGWCWDERADADEHCLVERDRGATVFVTSTRRDQNAQGEIRLVDEIGLTIAVSKDKWRVYPWGQIAHVDMTVDAEGRSVPPSSLSRHSSVQ